MVHKTKKQVVIIHGGDTFETHEAYLDYLRNFNISLDRCRVGPGSWKKWLQEDLGEGYEIILPEMPSGSNAKFDEWKLWLDKLTLLLNDEIILAGHSLGASFLVKYLSENKCPKKVIGVFLVAGVFDTDSEGLSLARFAHGKKIDLQTDNIYLYHSKDDPVVPFSALEKFKDALPQAHASVFEDRRHMNQPTFPELADDIRAL